MTRTKHILLLAAATAASLSFAASAQTPSLSEQDAYEIAREAYIYAYPLVLQDITRQQATNVAEPRFPHAPLNQLAHAPTFPPAEMKLVVRPNADTLYSAGWIDTGPEPVVLSVPYCGRTSES